ncbi:MAG: amidohydrolase family protein [Rhodothermaceae bacterium]|nr:amidohydrolase family protein [Rhodothermaceae bacterium]
MRYLLTVVLALFLIGCSSDVSVAESVDSEEGVYAFVNVNVVPMNTEQVLENQTVIVKDGRIVEVGPSSSVEVPEGAEQIEGLGKYLMPGLAEMHGHIPPSNQPASYIEAVLFMYVANGITTVRGMLGHDGQLELRERANANELVSPTLYLAGPSFNGNSVSSPEQAEQKVRQQVAEGWDLLKVHPGLTVEEFDAMANTANELGIRFGGHVPAAVGLKHAIDMGQETFDHIDGYIQYLNGESEPISDAAIAEVVEMTKESGAWVVPTMILWETILGYTDLEWARTLPELKYMPQGTVQQWITTHTSRVNNPNLNREALNVHVENRMKVLKALNEADARILMGTDAPQQFSVPGFSIHAELERMADADMTPYEIYRTGSVAVGEYFEEQDTFGLVAEGHRADLVLLNSNPLEDVARFKDRSGVMVRGVWLSENDIQSRLAEFSQGGDSAN